MKSVQRLIGYLLNPGSKKAFYVMVRCSDCGEEVRTRINRSSDFQLEYNPHNPGHYYTITREIIGRNCFNLMRLKLALSRDLKVLFFDTESCEFIKFDRE